MLKNLYLKKSMVHITAEELKELDREYEAKLLGLLKYLRKRNDKKIQKETMIKCQK